MILRLRNQIYDVPILRHWLLETIEHRLADRERLAEACDRLSVSEQRDWIRMVLPLGGLEAADRYRGIIRVRPDYELDLKAVRERKPMSAGSVSATDPGLSWGTLAGRNAFFDTSILVDVLFGWEEGGASIIR